MPFLNNVSLMPSETDHRWTFDGALHAAGSKGDIWTIAQGFVSDLGSVPQSMWWFLPPYGGQMTRIYGLHDWMCMLDRQHRGPGRHDTDGVFRLFMEEAKISWLRRWLTWGAVRVGCRMEGANRKDWLRVIGLVPIAMIACAPQPLVWLWIRLIWIAECVEKNW